VYVALASSRTQSAAALSECLGWSNLTIETAWGTRR